MPAETRKIRVFLADDHELLRAALRQLVSAQHDLQLVGEASDGAAAVEAIRTCSPDVAVMDVRLPSLDGPAATKQLQAACPNVKVLALSAHAGRDRMQEMRDAGAWGYVSKLYAAEKLLDAIRRVARGERCFDALVSPPG